MTHYHIVGVAGAGMSAIAHLLIDQGHMVSGCDMQENGLTADLASRGVRIERGHSPAHLEGVDTLVISSALRAENAELRAAREQAKPVLKRADLWRLWSESKPTLAVAGTHGKTTTTAMVALILSRLGYDPAYIVPAGGPIPGLPRFARWGTGPFVIEADEYDRLLLGLLPAVAILTSVDWDHVDIYPTRSDVEATFTQFVGQVGRIVIGCDEDEGVCRVRGQSGRNGADWQSYGFGGAADWGVEAGAISGMWTQWTLRVPSAQGGGPERRIGGRLQVPGKHNLLNAAGAVAAVSQFGVAPEEAVRILEEFQGAARRFEWKGEAGGATFIDDYAHNPAKVRATLAAARARYPDRRVVVYFQPHTFSRTAALLDPLAAAFDEADVVLVGDIYPSRERGEDFPGVDAGLLAQHIGTDKAEVAGDLQAAARKLRASIRPGDVVLTLGAGDGYKVGDEVRQELSSGEVLHGA